MWNPFKQDPEKVAARRDRRAAATEKRDAQFAAINARYADDKAAIKQAKQENDDRLKDALATNGQRYRAKINSINEQKQV